MKKEIDIHNYPKKLESALEMIKEAEISERNRKFILDFRDFGSLNGVGTARIVRYLGVLKMFAVMLNVDFDKATKEDITRVIMKIHQDEDYSPSTKMTYNAMLKRFYKWVKNTEDGYPPEVKWIKTHLKLNEKKLPANGELITEEEVLKLVNSADHPRDKAFVSVLYESGARVGEVGSLQIKNVRFDQYGAVLNVEGKTGSRPIRIISSTPHLMTWLQNHPFRDDVQSPLWVNIGNQRYHQAMRYGTISVLLKRLFQKAGIKKRFNPHMFRHSRATFLADHLTEFQMNQYFGWIQGSDMPSTYVHMNGSKIDESILELNGLKSKKEFKDESLKPKICSRCDTINAVDSKFCCKCAGILDIKTAYELQEKTEKEKEIRKNSDNVLNTLMKDPEFVAVFVNKIKDLGLAGNF